MTMINPFDPLARPPVAGRRDSVSGLARLRTIPRLIDKVPELAPSAPRRAKLWELSQHLHCSIIGTCLSVADLRRTLGKANLVTDGRTDHELHGDGVLLARQRDGAGKLLHKALDRQHAQAIRQLDKARTPVELSDLWRAAVKRGDIPGPYWATLTHPMATDAVVRQTFGDLHMLSHLVGAANRADIRRLSELEADNARLHAQIARQQDVLRDGFSSRDARIRDLNAILARRIADESVSHDASTELAALTELVADLERRLRAETGRRTANESRFERQGEQLALERHQRMLAEEREAVLRSELEALDFNLARDAETEDQAVAGTANLRDLTLLYVGGRPQQIGHLRSLSAQLGAALLHHDGGVDERSGRLAGLVSRADVVLFPVDCVSHEAVSVVKRLCRLGTKRYVPLRSTGLSSFAAALANLQIDEPGANPAARAAD